MKRRTNVMHFDATILTCVMVLSIMGLLVVSSASMVISDRYFNHPFYFLLHQGLYWLLALAVGLVVMRVPMQWWGRMSGYCLLMAILLLVLVLVPGIGRVVNGSRRWLSVAGFAFQGSECAKLAVVMYISSYLIRRGELLKDQLLEVVKPLLVLAIMGVLLLLEPDYGTTVVLTLTTLGLLFLGGMRLWQFALLFFLAAVMMALLVWLSPYRLARFTSFLHPWRDQFSGGYQLTQSLIALGRGGFWGVGLGNSIQKLFYLPEAHTDFIFAILTEELGLLGALAVCAMYATLVVRMLCLAAQAMRLGLCFQAYFVYGTVFWLSCQAAINIGVNTGLLPTKGITLPLMSYGGSSMLICAVAVAMVLRVAHECHLADMSRPVAS
jgi:cell division protein FtsW